MIVIQSKRRKVENILKDFPDAVIVDVTSKGEMPMVKFSPFYPVGNIPISFSEGKYSASVEGIWQGLKVFETQDVDESKFKVTSMKGLKRTVRKFGKPLGHRKGVKGEELLDYISARKEIYLPIYNWVLDHVLQKELRELTKLSKSKTLVLLDYETNEEIENSKKPLSHAGLIKMKIEGRL
ncbi:hypothetical protein [uncultured Tenacibaculum sp.]|uniref:DUF6939 family protein n=1 Tax=uncultured Tenacibaculum sp. TaxID=174713 RepID=UPI002616413E|nr:hypothetical protein [uncultured Tenacibaculum sp.]